LLLPRELEAFLPPLLLDFFVIVANGASSSLSLLNYYCLLPKDLETPFFLNATLPKEVDFLVMTHILLLTEEWKNLAQKT
jgi:hypothetical protein